VLSLSITFLDLQDCLQLFFTGTRNYEVEMACPIGVAVEFDSKGRFVTTYYKDGGGQALEPPP
jgi:hypothetical protein